MPQIGYLPQQSAIISGVVAPLAVLRFYQTGTSTPQNAYTDAALQNAVTSVTADSAGLFPVWYLNPNAAADYRYTLESAAGSVYYTKDNIPRATFTANDIGSILYPQTETEESANITPVLTIYAPRPDIYVGRHGAELDGATDDTSAFDNAILDAVQRGGGRVVFDGPTKLKNLAIASNVEVVGRGNPLVNLSPTASTDVAISATGALSGSASNLTVDAALGAYQVTATSTSGLAVGDWVLVSEQTFTFGTDGQKMEINRIRTLPGAGVVGLQTGLIHAYTTSATAQIQKLVPIRNFVLSGFTIQNATGSDGGGVALLYSTDFHVDGIGVIGPAAVPGVRMRTSAYGDMRNCIIRDGQGISAGGSSGLGVDVIEACHNIKVHHNTFLYYNENEIAERSSYIEFTNNHCRHADNAVNTHGNNNKHILIANNIIADTNNTGISVGYSSNRTHDENVTVRGNKIINSGFHGISVASITGDHHLAITVEDNEIIGVKLTNGGTTAGIFGNFADDLIIRNNRLDMASIVGDPAAGISVTDCPRAEVTGNRISNVEDGYGVQMTSCANYQVDRNRMISISSNNVITASSTGTNYVRDNVADDSTADVEAAVIQSRNSWNTSPVILQGSTTYNPNSLADGVGETTTVTVAGAALGDFASASFANALQGITVTAWVSATDTVSVRFQNESGGLLDLASGVLLARVYKA